MLQTILAIAGKPGLYKLVSRGGRGLIVETLDDKHRRMPAFATDRVISLADIAMYTTEEEVPLGQVLQAVADKYEAKTIDPMRNATREETFEWFGGVLPTFDRDRVHPSDVKKLIQWYNILVNTGITEFAKSMRPTEGDNIDDRKEEEKEEE